MKKILLVIVSLILIALFWRAVGYTTEQYIRGKYGTKCYARGNENKNIKHPIKFDTLDECLKSLQ